MTAFFHGVPWVHCGPALLAVGCSLLVVKSRPLPLKVLFGLPWLALVPNTAYIFTDIVRIGVNWSAESPLRHIAVSAQYLLLEAVGLASFLLALLPVEQLIHAGALSPRTRLLVILLANLLVGFGMVLGREYINSYVIVTQPLAVIHAAGTVVTSPQLIGLTLAFTALCTVVYWPSRARWLRLAGQLL